MTREEREEAIAYIKLYRKLDENLHNTAPKDSISYYATEKCLKYWDMAIQALSQEPCDDAISREAVLSLWGLRLSDKEIYMAIHDMPPVTQKSGKWIVDGSVDCYLDKVRCHCSECGKKKEFPADYDHIKQKLSISYKHPEFIDNHCPNCGARMEGSEE